MRNIKSKFSEKIKSFKIKVLLDKDRTFKRANLTSLILGSAVLVANVIRQGLLSVLWRFLFPVKYLFLISTGTLEGQDSEAEKLQEGSAGSHDEKALQEG